MLSAPELSDLHRRLIWLVSLRLLLVVAIVVPYYLYQPDRAIEAEPAVETAAESEALPGPPPFERQRQRQAQVLQILVAVVSVQTLLYLGLMRPLRRLPEIHGYLQFGGDLLLITLLIYELGPAASNFSLLYVFVISVAAVILPRRFGILLVATLAYLLYVAVELAPHLLAPLFNPMRSLAALGSPPPLPPAALDVPPETLVYSLAVHLIAFYGVGFLTSVLAGGAARAEEKLRRKHRDLAYLQVFHRDVLQSISSGLAATDLEGQVTSLNRAGEEVLGMSAQELVGQHVAASGLFTPDEWRERSARTRAEGGLREDRELRRSGEPLHVGCSLSLLRDGEGLHRGYIVIFQDLTESTKLREQLRIKDRMAAVGEMAAGLAHEVGNPLAAISGAVQMLAGNLGTDPAHRKLLDITLKESRRLDRTVKGFLQIAHPRERNLQQMDIAGLLAEDVTLLRSSAEVRDNHEIVAELDPPSAVITADPDQIGQVFWNLAKNALQAMPTGGRLTIAGGFVGSRYRVRFTDTGSGMTEEERTNLFHPFKSFFDGGNGLGMAIVYRLVQEHRGEIRVDSAPGRGSTITVDLPIHGSEAREMATGSPRS